MGGRNGFGIPPSGCRVMEPSRLRRGICRDHDDQTPVLPSRMRSPHYGTLRHGCRAARGDSCDGATQNRHRPVRGRVSAARRGISDIFLVRGQTQIDFLWRQLNRIGSVGRCGTARQRTMLAERAGRIIHPGSSSESRLLSQLRDAGVQERGPRLRSSMGAPSSPGPTLFSKRQAWLSRWTVGRGIRTRRDGARTRAVRINSSVWAGRFCDSSGRTSSLIRPMWWRRFARRSWSLAPGSQSEQPLSLEPPLGGPQ